MVGLRRDARRLLTRVNNQPHATAEDHADFNMHLNSKPSSSTATRRSQRITAEKTIPTPPRSSNASGSQSTLAGPVDLTVDNVTTDPKSDDDPLSDFSHDEGLEETPEKKKILAPRAQEWKHPRSSGNTVVEGDGKGLRLSGSRKSSPGNKRVAPMDDVDKTVASWSGSQQNLFKKPRPSPEFMNIHGVTPAYKNPKPSVKTYGRQRIERTCFRKPPGMSKQKAGDSTAVEKKSRPQFKMGTTLEDLSSSEVVLTGTEAMQLDDEEDILDLAETANQNTVTTNSNDRTIECSFCGDRVDKLMKEEYQDTYTEGKELTFKWQRRFCEYHKKQRAVDLWQERDYPRIDWSGLKRRMRQHNAFLSEVLNDKVPSHHRDLLKEKLKPGRRDLQQAMDAEDGSRPGALVGYYGPRGEKMMAEHIINSMSHKIRQRAAKDKLVASTGVQGGVSGFLQAVLVPHLAELLIKEDMNLDGEDWSARARDIIAESAETGELMNPEGNDQIAQEQEGYESD